MDVTWKTTDPPRTWEQLILLDVCSTQPRDPSLHLPRMKDTKFAQAPSRLQPERSPLQNNNVCKWNPPFPMIDESAQWNVSGLLAAWIILLALTTCRVNYRLTWTASGQNLLTSPAECWPLHSWTYSVTPINFTPSRRIGPGLKLKIIYFKD